MKEIGQHLAAAARDRPAAADDRAAALIYAIGAILCAVTWHVAVLMTARTLIGLAIGADSAIATAYIAEYAPAKRRGALSMLQQWMITVGILVAYLVALVILKVWPDATDVDWRWFFGLGAIPAIIGLIFRFEMPESPRWLIRKGRYEDAQKTFAKLDVQVSVEDVKYTAQQLEQADHTVRGCRLDRVNRRDLRPIRNTLGVQVARQRCVDAG